MFSGAIAAVEGAPQSGETVRIRAADGKFLAHAAYSPKSQIVARVWDWNESQRVDEDFFGARISTALRLRASLRIASDGLRLINAESDRLPGIICDRYGDILVMQLLSAGAERFRDALADALIEMTGVSGVYERSDSESREIEGLSRRNGAIRGAPPPRLIIEEAGLEFGIDAANGHKTGFYLDQRDNRSRVAALAQGRDVLDCFSYSGAFAVHALAAGARSVSLVDASASALAAARENFELNGLATAHAQFIEADVFSFLRELRADGKSFDLIVLDPPKFAPTAALAKRAARGYKDINLLAFKLLRGGGVLATFSCSGGVSAELFQKIVAGAALDAGVDARITAKLTAAPDHPVALEFPEGEYLKGLIVHVS